MIKTTRRDILICAPLLLSGCVLSGSEAAMFQSIENDLGGRIGLSAINTKSGRRVAYRGNERFALCSTFKAPLAAAVLSRIDAGSMTPSAIIDLNREPLLSNSPVSSQYAKQGNGMTVIAACEAAVSHSDNTAANVLLRLIGGPDAMTRFFRGVGDSKTRLDRYELALNSNIAGDHRDTTTPDSMVHSLRALLLGDVLAPRSRDLLIEWMINEQRGKARIRAGLPTDWRVANKPGTSTNGATNDIGVVWTPEGHPIVMAIYINAPSATRAKSEAAIESIARIAAERRVG